MRIRPPSGYSDIIPLHKTHRVLLPTERRLPVGFQRMNTIPVSQSEFRIASRDYALVFVSADEGKTYSAALILGVAARQNLYMTPQHAWDAHVYFPAYARRYPFCMTRVMSEGAELPERVACVERSAINDEGIALFDGQGAPLPDWAQRQKLLVEFETDLTRTEAMCTRIAELQLLEPFVMQAMRKGQETLRLTQMFRIDEAKVADLPVDILKEFADKDIMGCIYAHLLSLTNFNRLVMRQSPPGYAA